MKHLKSTTVNLTTCILIVISIGLIIFSNKEVNKNLIISIFSISGVFFPIIISIISSYNFKEIMKLKFIKDKKSLLNYYTYHSLLFFIILTMLILVINLYNFPNIFRPYKNLAYKILLAIFLSILFYYIRTSILLLIDKDNIEMNIQKEKIDKQ